MKAEKGSIRANLARLLVVACMLGFAGFVFAQTAMDPCAIYPKRSKFLAAPGASATFTAIPGVLGKQIYICSVEVAQPFNSNGATPALTLSYGVQVAGTPCATSSPYGSVVPALGQAQLGIYGANGGAMYGPGNTMVDGPVPAAAASPGIDVCYQGYNVLGATITYVIVP
jgi:hypothetical protein